MVLKTGLRNADPFKFRSNKGASSASWDRNISQHRSHWSHWIHSVSSLMRMEMCGKETRKMSFPFGICLTNSADFQIAHNFASHCRVAVSPCPSGLCQASAARWWSEPQDISSISTKVYKQRSKNTGYDGEYSNIRQVESMNESKAIKILYFRASGMNNALFLFCSGMLMRRVHTNPCHRSHMVSHSFTFSFHI